jgi:hypothetical protein
MAGAVRDSINTKMIDMRRLNLEKPVSILSGEEFLPKEGVTFAKQVLELI